MIFAKSLESRLRPHQAKKRAEFAEYYQICQPAENKFNDEARSKGVKWRLDRIEEVLAEQKGEVSE